jgi:diacylglycerol kinase (ATP)
MDRIEAGAIPVILNPAARSARANNRVGFLASLSPRILLRETTTAGDARRFAREFAEAGSPIVVAAGGDGTMNEVVNGLAEASVPARPALGLLPIGTMNVFARELGLPVRNPSLCWKIIERGATREIDLWRAGNAFFAQLAGVGLDAMIINRTTRNAKRRLGAFSYVVSLVGALVRSAPALSVSADGGPPLSGTAILMGNGSRYGGSFRVFPEALNDDGWLDVVVVHRHGLAEVASLFVDVLYGTNSSSPNYTRLRARRLRIDATDAIPFEVDGEVVGFAPLTVEYSPFPLRVIV